MGNHCLLLFLRKIFFLKVTWPICRKTSSQISLKQCVQNWAEGRILWMVCQWLQSVHSIPLRPTQDYSAKRDKKTSNHISSFIFPIFTVSKIRRIGERNSCPPPSIPCLFYQPRVPEATSISERMLILLLHFYFCKVILTFQQRGENW